MLRVCLSELCESCFMCVSEWCEWELSLLTAWCAGCGCCCDAQNQSI